MLKSLTLLVALLCLSATAAVSQVVIKVGYSPGGSYDAAARAVAAHIGPFLPNAPQVVVENVAGAGSYKLARLFAEAGARDGSEIAVIASALALAPIFEPDRAFDPTKVFYIGSLSSRPSYCVASKASGITTLDQLLTQPVKVGATGPGSSTYLYPALIKHALKAQFEIVSGFEGGAEIDLAMERGDVQARCGVGFDSLILNGMMDRVNIIAEIGPTKVEGGPKAEFLLDRITDPTTKAAAVLVVSSSRIHHPFILPPDTPLEIVAAYRNAFDAVVKDPAFLADAARGFVDVSPTSGAEVEATIRSLLASDPAIRDLARELVQ